MTADEPTRGAAAAARPSLSSQAAQRPSRRRVAVVAVLWTLAVSGLGQLVTDLGPWYYALKQPPWKPPDLWFGPAWTTIFTLTAWGCAVAWLAGAVRPDGGRARRALLAAVAVNSLLNVGWSICFFGLRRPDWAMWEWLPFWLSIVVLLACAWRLDRRAGALLLPYLLWVTFAGGLNAAVVQLNGPFIGQPKTTATRHLLVATPATRSAKDEKETSRWTAAS